MKFRNDQMHQMYFPGNDGQACEAWYGIAVDRDHGIAVANIVVIQSNKMNMGTSLWNSENGRNNVLTRILSRDLNGVRSEFVRLFIVIDMGGGLHCMEFPIYVDINDYVKNGNPHNSTPAPAEDVRGILLNLIGRGNSKISCWSSDVVGGCADFYTVFDEGKHVDPAITKVMLEQIGYNLTELQ